MSNFNWSKVEICLGFQIVFKELPKRSLCKVWLQVIFEKRKIIQSLSYRVLDRAQINYYIILSFADLNLQLLTLMVDGQGVHAIVKNSEPNKLSHRVYNLSSGKVEVDSKLPTNVAAFMGLQPLEMENMKFYTTGENEFVSVLLDGSSTVYPLVKDSTPTGDSIKDPQLLDLPPIQALGLGTHALPHVGSGKKNEVAVLVLAFAQQLILPKVLQCDVDAVKRLIAGLEAEPTSVTSQETVQAILGDSTLK